MRLNTSIARVVALCSLVAVPVDAQQSPTSFVTYPCEYKSADDMGRLLRPLLVNIPSVQLVVDRDRNRILLSGPDEAQSIARRLLNEVDRAARSKATSVPRSQQPQRSTARFVYVGPDRLERFQQQFIAVFNSSLRVHNIGQRQVFLLDTRGQPPGRLEVEFDVRRSGVLIGGPSSAVDQMVRLTEALTRDSLQSGYRSQVFRLQRRSQIKLRELIHKSSLLPTRPPLRAATSHDQHDRLRSPIPNRPNDIVSARFARGDNSPTLHRFGTPPPYEPPGNGVAWVRYLFQEREEAADPGEQPASDPELDATPTLRQFEGVDVESLPDLDVIILRGRNQDLDQLAEIIQQLERISQETQPEVRVVQLRHAQSEALAEMISEVSGDLISGRQGRVSVTALVKPNALLLVGWGDAVNAVALLIQQLDKPVTPESQSAVFRLRHASVTDIEQTLQSFFTNRPGLGPRIQLATDARTNSIIVYAAPRDMDEVRKLIQDLDRPRSQAVNRARIFQIENALATDVAETLQTAIQAATDDGGRSAILELQIFDANGQRILKSGTLQHIQITPNPRNNTIIVSSPRENLELIAELIRQLDSPTGQAKIKVFQIVHGEATGLVETLRSLIPTQQGAAVGPQLPSAADESTLVPLRFSVDVRSNSIIATGSEGDLRIVEALLSKLDQSTSLARTTVVYQLKNSPAVDVASAVNQYLVSRRRLETAAPGADNPFQEIEREVIVVPEPVANKLILAATPRYFEEISNLIEKLDEQPAQVVIQILIVEVALNNADEFGVELGLQDSVLFDRSLLGDLLTTVESNQASNVNGIITTTQEIIQAATNIPGFAFNNTQQLGNSGSRDSFATSSTVGGQGISNFAVGRGNDQLGFGGLVLSAGSQNVSVLIRALQESRRVDVLSRPQVRTLDNQPAFIQVGQRVPRIVGSTVNQNGQSNSVTLENVGLILGVTPRVSPDGTVVMEIDAEKSALGPEQDGIPVAVSIDGTVIRSPRVDTTTVQATVSAADGETIVLGGLITENDQYVHRSVPLLGDIPFLESLFRFDSHIARRTELLIILTPHVIRTAEDSERFKQAEMARMSWCASDVFRLHGDLDFYTEPDTSLVENGVPEVIYPDLNPSGEADRVDPPFPALPNPLP